MDNIRSDRNALRSKIVGVAARLLQEHGQGAVTTRRVAEEAGVQAPAIYRVFGDKDGLLDAVAEHVLATQVAAKAAIVEAASADDIDAIEDLRAGWESQIEFGVVNPTLFRLLSDPQRVQHSPAVQSGRRVLASRVQRVAKTGRLRVSEQRAVSIIHAAGTGVIQALLETPTRQRDTGLADEMYEAVLRQILTDPPERPGDGPKATAVALRAMAPELDTLSGAERRLLGEWLDRVVDTSS